MTVSRAARFAGWAGLTAAGALHAIWASGSPWPAKTQQQLAGAVAGDAEGLPDARATWAVAAAAFTGGAVAAGGLGERGAVVSARRVMGALRLTRALVGGGPALAALGLPTASRSFTDLDRRYYRPLFAVVGLAVVLGAKASSTD